MEDLDPTEPGVREAPGLVMSLDFLYCSESSPKLHGTEIELVSRSRPPPRPLETLISPHCIGSIVAPGEVWEKFKLSWNDVHEPLPVTPLPLTPTLYGTPSRFLCLENFAPAFVVPVVAVEGLNAIEWVEYVGLFTASPRHTLRIF
jgi:hypothetical protein